MRFLPSTLGAALFSAATLLPTETHRMENAPAKSELKAMNSEKGIVASIDYELLNCKYRTEAAEALNAVSRIPEQYMKLLWMHRTKLVVAASGKDLLKDDKYIYDAVLSLYKEKQNADRLCGVQFYTGSGIQQAYTSAVLLHGCGLVSMNTLHELGHALDMAAANAFVTESSRISELPEFQAVYCKAMQSLGKNWDCHRKMPNGTPESWEVFAQSFARYYDSDESNKELRVSSHEIHGYFSRLEKIAKERLQAAKQMQ